MKERNPYISVIVPVYNTGSVLKRCIDSLRKQSLNNIEIVIVDDGSDDGSEKICDDYAEKDSRIKVVHKENGGLAAARNTGIIHSNADFIMCVDSDDWVENDYCRIPFYTAKENNADLVLFEANYYKESGELIMTPAAEIGEGILSKAEAIYLLDNGNGNTVWNKLIKKTLLIQNPFPDGCYFEDLSVSYKLVNDADIISYRHNRLYNYVVGRTGSITSKRNTKKVLDMYDAVFRKIDDLKEWGYECSDYEVKNSLAYLVIVGHSGKYSKRCESLIKSLTAMPDSLSKTEKILVFAFRFMPAAFNFICIITGKRLKKHIRLYL